MTLWQKTCRRGKEASQSHHIWNRQRRQAQGPAHQCEHRSGDGEDGDGEDGYGKGYKFISSENRKVRKSQLYDCRGALPWNNEEN